MACPNELNETTVEDVAVAASALAALFLHDPATERGAAALDAMRAVAERPAEWPFAQRADAANLLLELAERSRGVAAVSKRYRQLFVGPDRLAAPPWGSVYLDRESVIFGDSTLALRAWMRAHGIVRSTQANDPDDHVGLMLQLLSWLAQNHPELLCDYLEHHFLTWVFRYLELLQATDVRGFYGVLARLTAATLCDAAERLGASPAAVKLYR